MGGDSNPWVTHGPTPKVDQETRPDSPPPLHREVIRGPSAPQPATVQTPEGADRLPTRQVAVGASVWWLGAHGGAGESTLASLALDSQSAGHAWPIPSDPRSRNRIVVVARTNYAGLMAAQHFAREWASGTTANRIDLLGLVLVADAPSRRPKELRQLEQHIAGGYPRLWTLPWVEAWRVSPVSASDMPREYRTLLADLNLTASTN